MEVDTANDTAEEIDADRRNTHPSIAFRNSLFMLCAVLAASFSARFMARLALPFWLHYNSSAQVPILFCVGSGAGSVLCQVPEWVDNLISFVCMTSAVFYLDRSERQRRRHARGGVSTYSWAEGAISLMVYML